MNNPIKQFVPSAVCLTCDGCCRFQLADTTWRPKVGALEYQDGVDWAGYMKTSPAHGHHQCVHFNQADSSCRIYTKRPFECALYPFVVSRSVSSVDVFMHLACPYIQDHELSPALAEYQQYLISFFNEETTQVFLKANQDLLHDYSAYAPELKWLFKIEV